MTNNNNNLPNEFEPEFADELDTEGMPDPLVVPTKVITIHASLQKSISFCHREAPRSHAASPSR